MKVLLINQYFAPDVAAVAQLMGDLVEDMASAGLEIGVITGRAPYNQTRNVAELERWDGVDCRVWRVPYIQIGSRGTVSRLLSYGTFMLSAFIRMLCCRRYDVVMVFTCPPLVGVLAWMYERLRRARVVSIVEDLYPDIAVALGFLPPRGLVTAGLSRLSVFLLGSSQRVVALSNGMKAKIAEKGVNESKISVIENWADSKMIQPLEGIANPFAVEHGVSGKFVVQYSGHMGEAHEFETILSAATTLRKETDIHFQFIGDGPRQEEIETYIRCHGQANVSLLPYQQRADLKYSLGAASVSVVTLRPELTGLIVPSKIYGILAAGKPVILVGSQDCEIAQILTGGRCGFVVEPGDSAGFVRAVWNLYTNPELANTMGKQARNLLVRRFDRGLQTGKYIRMLNELGAQSN